MGSGLKLIALDDEDLAVLSVHLQDAVVSVGDMAFQPGERRFVMLANRFDWESAVQKELAAEGAGAAAVVAALDLGPAGKAPSGCVRRRAGIRFEHVLGARVRGIDLKRKRDVLNLLLVTFEPTESPSGTVTFTFSGGGQLQLTVDCLEAGVEDLGPAWDAKGTPCHDNTA
ncbi:DUF2948 family protein [Ancylobacter sonchi]|uniref:DUF2948 family protein n=1 Tax=Ancylobacter sonchi TaxID=1937790 RepID=UPI001BD3A3D9|nr:DUF2948 family protein [Ancylobacter sonchi]MBS7532579.1 DUF2948 family protein [Ancylobacter sonchi]